jgi:hypothetical protein
MLLAVLLVSLLALVPGQTIRSVGIEFLAVALVAWVVVTLADIHSFRHTRQEVMKHVRLSVAIDQATMLFYLIAGAVVIRRGESGIYWLVPATLSSFFKAFMDAWVILVEINR